MSDPLIELLTELKKFAETTAKRLDSIESKISKLETNWKCISGTLDKDILINEEGHPVGCPVGPEGVKSE